MELPEPLVKLKMWLLFPLQNSIQIFLFQAFVLLASLTSGSISENAAPATGVGLE